MAWTDWITKIGWISFKYGPPCRVHLIHCYVGAISVRKIQVSSKENTSWPALIRERSNTHVLKDPSKTAQCTRCPYHRQRGEICRLKSLWKRMIAQYFPEVTLAKIPGCWNQGNKGKQLTIPKNGDPIFLQPDTRRLHPFSKCWGPLVWRFPTFGHCPTRPQLQNDKWTNIRNVLILFPQLRNDHQRQNVKRSITACDDQQVQNAGSALWIEKSPEHIRHNQGQRAYHEQADQGCSQAPTQNDSFDSSGVGTCVQDETEAYENLVRRG